jgi:hypothetical protein
VDAHGCLECDWKAILQSCAHGRVEEVESRIMKQKILADAIFSGVDHNIALPTAQFYYKPL